MSKLLVITTFTENPFNIWSQHQSLGVISRSSNRHVDPLRHGESENLPGEVAQESVQDKKSILMVKGQKTIFLFIKGFGRTCPSMNTVTDTSEKPKY